MNPEKMPLVYSIGETGYAEVLHQKQGELRDNNHGRRRQRRKRKKAMPDTNQVQDQKPTNGAETAAPVQGKQDVVPAGGEKKESSSMQTTLRTGAKSVLSGAKYGGSRMLDGGLYALGGAIVLGSLKLTLDYFNLNPFARG